MSYNNNSILSIKNLTVTYNRYGSSVRAIKSLSIDSLQKGSWTFLLGENGSGKSTLLKAMVREVESYSGTIELAGIDLNKYNSQSLSETVFLINQNPLSSTVDELTVFENLRFATNGKSKEEIETALRKAGLHEHKNHLAKNLSGGQRQLLALQIAQLRDVKLLLLDEPFAALDPINESKAVEMINAIWKKGTSIIFISHDNQFIQNPYYKNSNKLTLKDGSLS